MLSTASIFKKLGKIGFNWIQNGVVLFGRCAGLIDFPVPPNSSMRKTAQGSIRHYYMSGIRTYLPIATAAESLGIRFDDGLKMLDFGCGVGRQLLHFTRKYPSPQFYACDLDDTSVAFIQKHYPRVRAHTNRYHPPLAYDAEFFDLVYSVSIFTHLNPDDQVLWLNELARITKRSGYVFLTTCGYQSLRTISAHFGLPPPKLNEELGQHGLLYQEYPGWRDDVARAGTLRIASNLIGIKGSYGNTLMSPEFIINNWPKRGFEIQAIIEGIIDDLQDLVILRRT